MIWGSWVCVLEFGWNDFLGRSTSLVPSSKGREVEGAQAFVLQALLRLPRDPDTSRINKPCEKVGALLIHRLMPNSEAW